MDNTTENTENLHTTQVTEHTAIRTEFAEQTAACTRVMYGTPAMRTTHRLARLNVPVPSWMRAPGETPGMYAMDELAVALGMDPVELRDSQHGSADTAQDVVGDQGLARHSFGSSPGPSSSAA